METGTPGSTIELNGQGNSGTLRKHIEPEDIPTTIATPVFRSDLLEYSPVAKSGYVHFENDHPEDEDNGMAMAWLKCLKKHPDYNDLYIDENATIAEIYDLLHKETDRLCGNYSWVFTDEHNKPYILMYKSMGEIKAWNLPVEFFFTHENSDFQSASIYLIKQIAEAFKINIIYNELIRSILMWEDKKEIEAEELVKMLKHKYTTGDQSEDFMLYSMAADYLDYIRGDIRKCHALIEKNTMDKEGFMVRAEACAGKLPECYQTWLMDGIKLLENPCNIYDFHLTPHDLHAEGEEPLFIDSGIFFPWKFKGYVFDHYEEWLNDTANNIGTNDVYNYGMLTAKGFVPPNDPEPFRRLTKWLDDGREIYFNETEKPKRTQDTWKSEIMKTDHSNQNIF